MSISEGALDYVGPFGRLLRALEIILQLSMVHDNNETLKQAILSDKLELGPQLMNLLNLQTPVAIKSLAESILIRLRSCSVLLDAAAAEEIRKGGSPSGSSSQQPMISHADNDLPAVIDLISSLDVTLKSMGVSTIRRPSGLAFLPNVVFGNINLEHFYEKAGIYVMVVCVSRKYSISARCR